jgi:putative endopeptidase
MNSNFSNDKNLSEFNFSENYHIGNDFYNYVNKKWIDDNNIPEDKNRWGTFDVLREESRNNVRKLVEDISTNDKSSNNILNSNEKDILTNLNFSSKNIEPIDYKYLLNDFVQKIFNSKNKEDLINNVFEVFTLNGINTPVYFDVCPDLKNSNINGLHVEAGGLGLPDKDYYFSQQKKDILDDYKIFMKNYLSLFMEISDEMLEKIFNIEKELAEVTYSNVEKRDPTKLDNATTFNNLNKNFKYLGLNKLNNYVERQNFFNGKVLKKINICNVKFIKKYEYLVENLELNDLIHYFLWMFLLKIGSFLNEKVIEVIYNFYHKRLGGAKKNTERWERVIDIESDLIGEIIGKIYVNYYFPEKSKKRALDLVDNVKKEFRNRLVENNWMGDKTKKNAIDKLDSMNVKIGYPDKFKDYTLLYGKLSKDNSFLKNCLICKGILFYDDLKNIYEEKDKSKWFMNVFDVNAYYSPQYNEIVFPAAILQKPFFSDDYPDSLNYGGIGVVIGHEITHGFDDQGRKFDKDGNLNNWYEEKDIITFNKITDKLKKQFSNYYILGQAINGELTLGENIADLGGVCISMNSLKNITNDDQLKTVLQEFFYNYARVWRINAREEELKRRLQTDPHSPGEWRVNGILTNIDEFYSVFEIKDGDIYKNINDRVAIW